jgi:2'-5' RNA ligase
MKCVYIPVEGKGIEAVEALRKDFDTLYSKIEPHITVVFPFDYPGDIGDVVDHIKNALQVRSYKSEDYAYEPHVTIGREVNSEGTIQELTKRSKSMYGSIFFAKDLILEEIRPDNSGQKLHVFRLACGA